MPPALIMAILAAASMAANAAGQKKVDKNRAAAMREDRLRREKLAAKSDEAAKSTAEILTSTGGKEAAAAEERAAAAQAMRDTVNPVTNQTTGQMVSSTFAPSNSTRVIEDTAQSRAQSAKYLSQQDKSRAALSSFGDVMVGNNIGVQRNAQDLDQFGSSYRNWNQFVLPQQLEAANQSGRKWQTLADVLQVASMIYGGVGLVNGATGAAANAGANVANDTAANLTGDALTRAGNNAYWLNQGYGANYLKPIAGTIY